MSNLKKAIDYFELLGNTGNVATYICGLHPTVYCCLEKYLCVTIIRILEEIYNTQKDFSNLLQLKVSNDFDFYDSFNTSLGYMESGVYMLRGNIDYMDSPVYDLVESIYNNCQWKTDYIFANLPYVYNTFTLKKDKNGNEYPIDMHLEMENDAETYENIFSLRTDDEIMSDFLVDNFFDKNDLHSDQMTQFLKRFRESFSSDIETSTSIYFLVKSQLLPSFLAFDKTIICKKDLSYVDIINSCINVLCNNGHGFDCFSCYSAELKWSYFMFDFSVFYDGYTEPEREYGGIALDPRVLLVPYIIDESIKRLDEKYHIIKGERV